MQSDKEKKCDIKVLILLYSPRDSNYLGYIPNEQPQFVDCIRKVIQQQKEQQRVVQNQVSGAGPMPQQQQPGTMMSQGQVITSSQFAMQAGGSVSMAPNGKLLMSF